MIRKYVRQSGQGYSIQATQINGVNQEEFSNQNIALDNISKGGFRFTTSIGFELEDRIHVILNFPDKSTKEVLGRICYSETIEVNEGSNTYKAYGFSILNGFYELTV